MTIISANGAATQQLVNEAAQRAAEAARQAAAEAARQAAAEAARMAQELAAQAQQKLQTGSRDSFETARSGTASHLTGTETSNSSSTLLTEDTGDSQVNCLHEVGEVLASDPQLAANSEVVFLRDTRPGAEGETGHVVIQQGDQLWDPATGEWSSVTSFLRGHPEYEVAGTASGEAVRDILAAEPGPDRDAAIARAGIDPALVTMQVADPPDPRVEPINVGELMADPALAQLYIEQLESSGPPLDQFAATLTLAIANPDYQRLVEGGAQIMLTTSEGNLDRPVLALVPPNFDPTQATPVHTHYHGQRTQVGERGDISSASDPGTPADHGTTAMIESIWANSDPAPIIILPEADPAQDHGVWHREEADGTVTNPNQAQTTDDAVSNTLTALYGEEAASNFTASEYVVSAHSRGGSALYRSIASSEDGERLRADRLLLLECVYDTGAGSTTELLTGWAQTPNGGLLQSVDFYRDPNGENLDANADLERIFADENTSYTFHSVGSHFEAMEGMTNGYESPAEATATPAP